MARRPNRTSFSKENPRPGPGRPKGAKNRWRKADLEKMREHIQSVLDAQPGGVEEFLEDLAKSRKTVGLFVSVMRDVTPKPVQKVQADGELVLSWKGERTREK